MVIVVKKDVYSIYFIKILIYWKINKQTTTSNDIMTSVLGQMAPRRCKQNCENKWWLYINMKINHAVVHILNGFE